MRSKSALSRRHFLHMGAIAATGAASGWWINQSQEWSARFLRERFDEIGDPIVSPSFKPAPASWESGKITLSWLGHSTVLINFFGLTILTDPVLGARVGANIGRRTLGPKRLVAPALKIGELPKIDLVLLSHAHFDHMDMPTLAGLNPERLVTSKATLDLLKKVISKPAEELAWGEKAVVRTSKGEVEIEAFEVNHWGARWKCDTHRGYNGYIVSRGGKKLVFGGDTAMTDHFKKIRGKGPFEIACMPIGAYDPWPRSHCTPEEAVRMTNDAGAHFLVPLHHKTFNLGREALTEPIQRLQVALQNESQRIALQEIGQTFVLPSSPV